MMGYNQSYGSCVLHVVSWFNICVKLMKIYQAVLNLCGGHKNCQQTKGNNSESRKPELRFLCSIRRLMVSNISVKFHETM